MIKTLGGKFVKAVAVALAAVCMLGCALMFTGCESRYPEITMRISFNGESYELRYKLSRDLYSQTVAHYLELIDLGYFDGTVIHDYQSDRLIGGGYTYADMENGDEVEDLTACDYDAATTDAEGNVTLENVTVWADADRTQATNRLHGETSANGFSIESGNGLRNRFGTLGAYTYVGTGEKNIVYYAKSSDNGYGSSEYYKNSFTSMSRRPSPFLRRRSSSKRSPSTSIDLQTKKRGAPREGRPFCAQIFAFCQLFRLLVSIRT